MKPKGRRKSKVGYINDMSSFRWLKSEARVTYATLEITKKPVLENEKKVRVTIEEISQEVHKMSMDKREAIDRILKSYYGCSTHPKCIDELLTLDKTEKEWCECKEPISPPRIVVDCMGIKYSNCTVCWKEVKPSPKVEVKVPENLDISMYMPGCRSHNMGKKIIEILDYLRAKGEEDYV